jgi:hypothetical protein
VCHVQLVTVYVSYTVTGRKTEMNKRFLPSSCRTKISKLFTLDKE